MNWRSIFRLFSSKGVFEEKIKSIVGFYPDNAFFYELAFTHKSVVNGENGKHKESNERLEFLGDAILSAVVSDHLYKKYKKMKEGSLSTLRSKIVSRSSLNEIGQQMKLSELMIANVNEAAMKNSVQGNALEALIGAVYLDQGYQKTASFILKEIIQKHIKLDELIKLEVNYKSRILEWGQKNKKEIQFVTVKETGAGTHKRFTVALLVDNKKMSEAVESSKKKAEQKAAKLYSSHVNQ